MKLIIKHTGFVKNGRKVYDNPALYTDQIRSLEGKQFVEEIKEKHHSVTQNQYGYYRGAILPTCHKSEMFKHFDTKDSIHENLFAPMFLSYIVMVKLPDRKPYEQAKIRSLADLSKDEMSEFIERVIAWCENEGISIPSPEMYYNKYYQR